MADSNLQTNRRFSRRAVTLFWSALSLAIIVALLYYERIDVLYILATLGLVALLIIVAKSDLTGKSNTMES